MPNHDKTVALIYADLPKSDERYAVQRDRISHMMDRLCRLGCEVSCFVRDEVPSCLNDFELVIAAGGDGTTLEVASFLRETPILPVRLFPEISVGFLCTADFDIFERNDLNLEDFFVTTVPRLQCLVDGVPHDTPILNEVLIAHPCPARASRYEIVFRGQREIQCSSGIWVATQPGSHGAAHAAGAQALDVSHLHDAVFCVRECSKPQNSSIKTNIFEPNCENLAVKVISPELCLFFDGGLTKHVVKCGQTVTFRAHPQPLRQCVMCNALLM